MGYKDLKRIRRRVDLRMVPLGIRYIISALIVVCVVAIAWIVGRERPVPPWVEYALVPALGWIYLGLVAAALWHYFAKRRKR
jgi:hypothetical protein